MLLVAAEGTRPVRRRYTIRELDATARLITLDIVLHGAAARAAALGAAVDEAYRELRPAPGIVMLVG